MNASVMPAWSACQSRRSYRPLSLRARARVGEKDRVKATTRPRLASGAVDSQSGLEGVDRKGIREHARTENGVGRASGHVGPDAHAANESSSPTLRAGRGAQERGTSGRQHCQGYSDRRSLARQQEGQAIERESEATSAGRLGIHRSVRDFACSIMEFEPRRSQCKEATTT